MEKDNNLSASEIDLVSKNKKMQGKILARLAKEAIKMMRAVEGGRCSPGNAKGDCYGGPGGKAGTSKHLVASYFSMLPSFAALES